MAKRKDFVESRRKKRRKQIFEGASKVFSVKGYHATTVQEIADAAGLAKGTMYEHVKSKEEILFLVTEEGLDLVKNDILKSISGIDDPLEKLRKAILTQMKVVNKYRNSIKVVMHEMHGLSTEKRKVVAGLKYQLIEIYESIIKQGIKEKRFKRTNTVLASELLINMCITWIDYGEASYQKSSWNNITDLILQIFLEGIEETKNT